MIGQRFIEHDAYQRARDAGVFRDENRPIPGDLSGIELLSAEEMRAELHLRTFSDLTAFDIDGTPFPGLEPAFSTVPGQVETIPTEGIQVYLGEELSETVEAGPANDGQPLPETALNFGGFAASPTKLPRFGSAAPVALSTLDEPGLVSALIDRRVRLGFPLGLEREILTGQGGFWTGITQLATNATGDATHAIGLALPNHTAPNYRSTAITNAIADVQANGWYQRRLQVVSHPQTRADTYTEVDGQNRPIDATAMFDDQIDGWLVSKYMTKGTAIVADLFDAVALFLRGPLEVAFARNHNDFLARGLVEMTLSARCYSWVRQPPAIAIVTGL